MKASELKKNRKALGLTQADLAEKLGISRKSVNNYETNLVPIPKDKIELLEQVFCYIVEEPGSEERQKKIIKKKTDHEIIATLVANQMNPYIEDLEMKLDKVIEDNQELKKISGLMWRVIKLNYPELEEEEK